MKMINDKKAWVTRDYVVGIMIFSAIIALAFILVQSMSSEYNEPDMVDKNFNSTFDKFSENTENIEEIYSSVNSSEGLTPKGTFDVFFESTFSVITLIFSSLTTIGEQIFGFGSYFEIPSEVSGIFLLLILMGVIAMVVFIVISSISRGKL